MEIVDKKKFMDVESKPPFEREDLKTLDDLTESEFNKLMVDMQNPVKAQKYLAVQIKYFLDQRIINEMREKGFLSDHTRRWVKVFNEILDKIQKALYGDKSLNLHIHKVTHSQIAMKMREVDEVEVHSKKRKKAKVK